MKAIEEYKVTNATTGLISMYPKTVQRVNYKNTVLTKLEGFKKIHKDEYTMWERYDEFIENSIKDSNLNINIYSLIRIKNKYLDMQKNSTFFTNDDFKSIMNDINDLYELIIKEIEKLTDKKFGKDYVLM